MTRLLEDDALRILADHGLAVPEFVVASNGDEAARATADFGGESVLKALIPASGRAAAGAIRIARSPEEGRTIAEGLLGEKVLGFRVDRILVSRLIDAEWEISVVFAPDPSTGAPTLFASALGGIDVTEVLRRDPASLVRRPLHGEGGISADTIREVARDLGLGTAEAEALVPALSAMYRAFTEADATLLEVNPLIIATDRTIVAPTATLFVN
jgi:succinyl-CoA synthetase beta subunit